MDPGLRINPFIHEHEDPDDQGSHENGTPHSPSSGDETKLTPTTAPSPKKSRRSTEKRVVTVPIADVEGSKSKGDAYPPSDSWAWRKYGQKPIKGSPYPRGYYRCSSSKGCPARKQVERSRVDPTMLIITYAFDHNHPLPATKNHHSATSTVGSPPAASFIVRSPDELGVFATQPELDLCRVDSSLLSSNTDEFGWFDHVVPSDPLFDSPICAGSSCHEAEVATMFSMREEDVSLFADLGDLPDCSVVFRRCSLSTVPCCGSTG